MTMTHTSLIDICSKCQLFVKPFPLKKNDYDYLSAKANSHKYFYFKYSFLNVENKTDIKGRIKFLTLCIGYPIR